MRIRSRLEKNRQDDILLEQLKAEILQLRQNNARLLKMLNQASRGSDWEA
jgi:hypothetical protein